MIPYSRFPGFTQDFGMIMGLVLTFTGSGSVDYAELKDLQDNSVLADSFL